MHLALALLALATQAPDTTVAAARGQRLAIDLHGGSVTVGVWDRPQVRVRVTGAGSRTGVEVETSGPTIEVEVDGPGYGPATGDLEVTAPAWLGVSVDGVSLDVTIRGIRAPISVETVEGDVEVDGGDGAVDLNSVQGSVRLRNARGRIKVTSVNESVRLENVQGDLTAETVNGDVTILRADATGAEGTSVNGDIVYDGPIKRGGSYAFTTHNGDVTVPIADGTGVDVNVATFGGEFVTDVPVRLEGQGRRPRRGPSTKRYSFTLGGGGARLDLESFQGTIRLVKPGSAHLRPGTRGDDHD